MPDSEELDEILKEIKNINAPKEKPEPKEEQPLTLADDKPAKEEAEAKPKPVKENVNFNDFSSFNSAQHSDIPKDNKGEKEMPKKKAKIKTVNYCNCGYFSSCNRSCGSIRSKK